VSLPGIEPYPLPTSDRLPSNTAGWTIDPARAALLVHDMQRYFLRPFPVDRDPGTTLVSHCAQLLHAARAGGVPVVYTAQPGAMSRADRGLLHDFWGEGMGADPADRAVLDELAPAPGEPVLTKWRPSAFIRTDLRARLERLGRDQLVICGVYAHVGILLTAAEACAHDIQPFVVADAVADFSWTHHRRALDYAACRCAMVVSSAEAAAALGGASA
jgi:trans-2,3-dihydro-3-hydroxyanthranilic acid synthase